MLPLRLYFLDNPKKSKNMVIMKDKAVTISYVLRNGENALIEQTTPDTPLAFLFGAGGMLPDFEAQLLGLQEGNSFDFEIKSDRAYGKVDANAVVDLPLQTFIFDGKVATDMLVVGKMIPMRNDQNQLIHGKIVEVKEGEEKVVMDFNHPLAGVDLHFTGKILEVRAATAEEIAHGHIHGPGGHQH